MSRRIRDHKRPDDYKINEPDRNKPPCLECGALTVKEAEIKCICSGDKDHCHGCELWEI